MADSALSYPFDTVVRITDTIGAQSWQGSGVLISPDEVLTASHVVYSQGVGSATNITVAPAYDSGVRPYGSASGAAIHYFQINDANDLISSQQSQSDYAIIHLSSSFDSVGTMGIEANFAGGTVNVTGYPASADGAQVTSTQTVTVDPYYTLLEGTSIGAGSSGGPVWIETTAGPEVVGLVSSVGANGTGYFVQITTSVLDQIEAWVTEDNGSDTVNAGAAGTGGNVVSPGGFNPGGNSPDILWQNADGQAAIWDDERDQCDRRRGRVPQSGSELDRDRNRRLQRRRPCRHPVAERRRSGRDLGDERDQCDRRRTRRRRSGLSLASGRSRRLQRRRPFRHPVAERERASRDLGPERDQRHRRRTRRRQSRTGLEGGRNRRLQRRRPFRHPVAEHGRPSRDLGNERRQCDRRRPRRRRSWSELESSRNRRLQRRRPFRHPVAERRTVRPRSGK